MSAISGTIRITIIDGFAGLTATATLSGSSYSSSSISNASGIISIPVNKYGTYHITYSDVRVRGDSVAQVTSNTVVELSARYSELITYTLRIDETNSNPNTAGVYQDDAVGMIKGSDAWIGKLLS